MAKRRDREFTPEEAFAITLREVTPHWYRSEPLVVGVDAEEGAYPQPLRADIRTGTWVFFFVSATSPVFDRSIAMLRLWQNRFSSLGVRFVFAFRGNYAYFNERKAIEAWLASLELTFPCVCDFDGSLAKGFGTPHEPGIAILDEGKVVYSGSGERWLEGAEARLQSVLRGHSPGLPLWPVASETGLHLLPVVAWPLRAGADALVFAKVKLVGQWVIEDDRIVTADSKAELSFVAPGSAVEIVARNLGESGDPTRIRFDTQGASFSDQFAGKDFVVDHEGNSSLLLSHPRAYSALRGIPSALRTLRFRFPFSKVSPVAIYGLEFANS
jgi:hypothetical protein